jgi:glucokinase
MTAAPDPDLDPVEHQVDPLTCALAVALGPSGRLAVGLVSTGGEVVAAERVDGVRLGNPEPDVPFGAPVAAVIESVLHAAGLEPGDAAGLPGLGLALPTVPVTAPSSDRWWRNRLSDDLGERFRTPVRCLTGAVAVTVGEHWRGAARGRRNVLGLVVDDAVDGGLVIDRRLVTGTTGNAGHIGHTSVDPFGPECPCGGRGCLDVIAGGTAVVTWARTHANLGPDATVAALAAAARRGEPVAQATFRRAGEALGMAVANAVTLLDLDVVVISGSTVAAAGPALTDPLADSFARFSALGYASLPRVVPAVFGPDAPLLGCAAAVHDPTSYPSG